MIKEVEAERDAIVKQARPQYPKANTIKVLAQLVSEPLPSLTHEEPWCLGRRIPTGYKLERRSYRRRV
jgi:hypothetical protein